MTIELNGERVELADGALLRDAVSVAGVARQGRGVAVAVDGEVVPRRSWDELVLADGQRVEVVGAVQGG